MRCKYSQHCLVQVTFRFSHVWRQNFAIEASDLYFSSPLRLEAPAGHVLAPAGGVHDVLAPGGAGTCVPARCRVQSLFGAPFAVRPMPVCSRSTNRKGQVGSRCSSCSRRARCQRSHQLQCARRLQLELALLKVAWPVCSVLGPRSVVLPPHVLHGFLVLLVALGVRLQRIFGLRWRLREAKHPRWCACKNRRTQTSCGCWCEHRAANDSGGSRSRKGSAGFLPALCAKRCNRVLLTALASEGIAPRSAWSNHPASKPEVRWRPRGFVRCVSLGLSQTTHKQHVLAADVCARKNVHNPANSYWVMTSDAKLTLAKARPN